MMYMYFEPVVGDAHDEDSNIIFPELRLIMHRTIGLWDP